MRVVLATMALELGGAETHVVGLALCLAARGHQVLVASAGGRLVERLVEAGIPHHRVPLASRHPWHLWRGVLALRKLVGEFRPHIMHAHARIPAFLCERVRGKVPLVTTYHGAYSAGFPWSLVTRAGDFTIAVSEDIEHHLQSRFGFDLQRIAVIPNGIDTECFRPGLDTAELRRQLGFASEDRILFHASRLSADVVAATLYLIERAPSLLGQDPHLHLLIAGDGPMRPRVEREIASANRRMGRQGVRWVGLQDNLALWYNLAEVVIGAGRVALEALACGRPVVVLAAQDTDVFVGGRVESGSWERLARTNFTARGAGQDTEGNLERDLALLLEEPGRAAEWGAIGRRLVCEKYSLPAVCAQIEKVYQLVVEERARR